MESKLIIAGGRSFRDYNFLKEKVSNFIENYKIDINKLEIICGMANGADLLGKCFAEYYKIPIIQMPEDWNRYNKSAGYIRNEEMAKIATHCICFWDKKSKGTKNMIDLAKKYNLKYRIHFYENN